MSGADRFSRAARDEARQARIRYGTGKALAGRARRVGEVDDWEALRRQGAEIQARALADLDRHLEALEARIVERGGRVHWASDAEAARRTIVQIAREAGARCVTKSKSMTGEEIEINEALEAAGIEPVETDLGEYIVQLAGAKPVHIVAPALDRGRDEIGRLFADRLGVPYTEEATELTRIAREHLRKPFFEAEVGLSGVNFAVAETGTVVVIENEGNARLTTRLPGVHIALMGIEKVVARLDDLSVLLRLLPMSATGQKITSYVNHFTGSDREFHLVILDNGRSRVLADPRRRELLHCIRCGACLNVCPVYQTVGGGPYGWVYPGPIGIALAPWQRSPGQAHASGASSLCGACSEICPVGIDLAGHIVAGRAAPGRPVGVARRLAFFLFGLVMGSPALYALAARAFRAARVLGVDRLWPVGWTRHREAPRPARRFFRERWDQERSG